MKGMEELALTKMELRTIEKDLDKMHQRAGIWARSNDPVLREFGREAHTALRDLLKTTGRARETIERGKTVKV